MGERIGYIGLGKMGLALSKVLLEDGHEVCGYDVDEERKKMLADARSIQAEKWRRTRISSARFS